MQRDVEEPPKDFHPPIEETRNKKKRAEVGVISSMFENNKTKSIPNAPHISTKLKDMPHPIHAN